MTRLIAWRVGQAAGRLQLNRQRRAGIFSARSLYPLATGLSGVRFRVYVYS
jgi:hypothetical protein